MKLLFQSHNCRISDINTYGGLEIRYSVNWAHYLATIGHTPVFAHPGEIFGASTQVDFTFDAATSSAYRCPDRSHFHNYFSPEAPSYLHCGHPMLHPTKSAYRQAVENFQHQNLQRFFAPIPYLDSFLPTEMPEPFNRRLLMWANKGSFTPGFGEHRRQAGMSHLRMFARLSQDFDFEIVFGGAAFVDVGEFEPEVRELLTKIPHRMLDRIPWTELVKLMCQSKLSINPGGITGCVFEAIYAKSIPVLCNDFGFFGEESREANMLPEAVVVSEAQIEDTFRRLLSDREYYYKIHDIFQQGFEPHRRPAEAWSKIEEYILSTK